MEKRNLKIILYLKNNTKPVVISESSDETIDQIGSKYEGIFDKKKENNKLILKTKNDYFITKNGNISGVFISSSDKHIDNDHQEKTKKENTKDDKNEYHETLRIQ